METLRKHLGKVLTQLCAIALLALVLIVLLGIASNQFKLQITWTEEAAKVLLTWVVMLGAALAYLENAHLGVDVLTTRFTPSAQRAAKIFATLVVLIFSIWVMIYGGWKLFQDGLESNQMLPAIKIRKAWFYLSVPFSGTLIALFALDNFRRLFLGSNSAPSDDQPHAPEESIG